jgi:hypothetical protein
MHEVQVKAVLRQMMVAHQSPKEPTEEGGGMKMMRRKSSVYLGFQAKARMRK